MKIRQQQSPVQYSLGSINAIQFGLIEFHGSHARLFGNELEFNRNIGAWDKRAILKWEIIWNDVNRMHKTTRFRWFGVRARPCEFVVYAGCAIVTRICGKCCHVSCSMAMAMPMVTHSKPKSTTNYSNNAQGYRISNERCDSNRCVCCPWLPEAPFSIILINLIKKLVPYALPSPTICAIVDTKQTSKAHKNINKIVHSTGAVAAALWKRNWWEDKQMYRNGNCEQRSIPNEFH